MILQLWLVEGVWVRVSRESLLLLLCSESADTSNSRSLTDCVAETPDQLMYIKGDELILLRELGDILLASCEGVVGWVKRADVRFDSLAGASSSPRQSHDLIIRNDLPRTVLTEPSPPMRSIPLPEAIRHGGELDAETMDPRRISGPFELESPQLSPGVEKAGTSFFDQQYVPPQADTANDNKRESMASIASSEALGGIGGFMMGGDGDDGRDSDEELEELRGEFVVCDVPDGCRRCFTSDSIHQYTLRPAIIQFFAHTGLLASSADR